MMGYKYGILSTIGTAAQNNVFAMIPARDEAEFELLPQDTLRFVHDWLAWTDAHLPALRNQAPIPTLGEPALGAVDGTSKR